MAWSPGVSFGPYEVMYWRSAMRGRLLVIGVAGVLLSGGAQLVLRQHGVHLRTARAAGAAATGSVHPAVAIRSELPSPQTAKMVLNSTMRHGEWLHVPAGGATVRAFIVYPARADKAPVVLVTSNQGLTDWIRAVGDQVAAEGFIAVAPDFLTGLGPNGGDSDSFATTEAIARALGRLSRDEIKRRSDAIRDHAVKLPSANGEMATLDFNVAAADEARIVAAVDSQKASFDLKAQAWPQAMAFLNEHTYNRPVFLPSPHVHAEPAMAAITQERRVGPRTLKRPDLPADHRMAKKVLATSPRRGEWVDIPAGDVKLHTWISYPERNDKVPLVVVIHPSPGYMEWTRGVADQLAQEGFLALAPDFLSGMAPNGGGQESFEYPDDIVKARGRLKDDEAMRRLKAAREYGLKLPMANGRSAALGFCWGGGMAFSLAAEIPELNAAVVYYGGAPDPAAMAKINAPVIGFYGTDDARLIATVEPTAAAMKKLGKSYEPHIYEHGTHAFLYMQGLASNREATEDAWPRTIAFLRQHMK